MDHLIFSAVSSTASGLVRSAITSVIEKATSKSTRTIMTLTDTDHGGTEV